MFPADSLKPIYDFINQICNSILSIADANFWFGIFPFIAIFIALYGLFHRYRNHQFSYSSQSSQFLNRDYNLSQSLNLFHYGIIVVLGFHFIFILINIFASDAFTTFANENSNLIMTFEILLWTLTIGIIIGMIFLLIRRIQNPNVRKVTTLMDWILIIDIFIQVNLGLLVATFNYPGSSWFIGTVVPWLGSLVQLHPVIDTVGKYDGIIRLHMLNGFVIFALLPYTRLVHFLSFPYTYLTRKYQVVVWYSKNKSQKVNYGEY